MEQSNNPMEEPHGSSGRGKARPEISSRARWFGAKIVPPRTPHGIGECSGRPLGPDLMKPSDPIGQILRVPAGPQSSPKYKVALIRKLKK